MKNLLKILFLSISLTLLLTACGGGGGGGGTANHAPVLAAISNVTMFSGNTHTFDLSATDADGNTISYSVTGGSVSTVSAAISGSSLTITPAAGYTTTTPITFTATASDGKGGSNSKTFTVTVNAPTQAVVRVSIANIPAEAAIKIGLILFTLNFPAIVTPVSFVQYDPVIPDAFNAIGSVAFLTSRLAASDSDPGYYNLDNKISFIGVARDSTKLINEPLIDITFNLAGTVFSSDFNISSSSITDVDLSASYPVVTFPLSVTFK